MSNNLFTQTIVQGNAQITQEYLPDGTVKISVSVVDPATNAVGKFSATVVESALNMTTLNGQPFDLIEDMIAKATANIGA